MLKLICVSIISVLALAATGEAITAHIDDDDAALGLYGYVKGGSEEDRKAAIILMQEKSGLEPTGILTNETLAYLHKARCGDHDTQEEKPGIAKRETAACTDLNAKCPTWKSYCGKHNYMVANCKKTCNTCLVVTGSASCMDHHANCQRWKSYCGQNRFVDANCKKTCNTCPGTGATGGTKVLSCKGTIRGRITRFMKTDLTYCIYNWPSIRTKMTHAEIRTAIKDGLGYWEPYAKIKFTEITDCTKTDFFLSFGKNPHSNKSPSSGTVSSCVYSSNFKSAGSVLAHAYFPKYGNLHFDDNEEWTEGTSRGVNLRLVAVHEMGHALGLAHSTVKGAVMYAYYQGYLPKSTFKLPQDDIDRISRLYSNAQGCDLSGYKRKKRDEQKLPICFTKKINMIFDFPDGYTYVMADGVLYRRNADGVDKEFQKKISEIWKNGITEPQAAVFVLESKTLYLFAGKTVSYAKYNGQELDKLDFTTTELKSSGPLGYNGEVSAAFGSGRKNFIYLVEGQSLLKFSTVTNKIIGSAGQYEDFLHPDAAARYPPSIDGAYVSLASNAKEVFFFTGLSYYKGTKEGKRYFIPAEYPKHFLAEYMRC